MKRYLVVSLLCWAWLIAVPVHASDDALANLRQTGKAFAAVARAASPSVVYIQVEGKTSSGGTLFFHLSMMNGRLAMISLDVFLGIDCQESPRMPRSG